MCHAWPCCDPGVFTVRLYAPDGTTRWVRNYSSPSETLTVPLRARISPATGDVIVASGAGVTVVEDGVVVERFNLRAYAPDGTTKWRIPMPSANGGLGMFPVGVRDFDIDAAGTIHVLTNRYSHTPISDDEGQTIIRCSQDGVWLDPLPLPPNPAFESLGVTVNRTAGPQSIATWSPPTDGATGGLPVYIITKIFVMPSGRWAVAGINPGWDPVLGERWPMWLRQPFMGDPPSYLAHGMVNPRGPFPITEGELFYGVAGDAQGRVVFLGQFIWEASVGQLRHLGQYQDAPGLPLLWTRPGEYPGPLDVNPSGRIGVARIGGYGTFPGGNESRVATVVVLNSDGTLAWQHFHAMPQAISVGLDGAVAVCHGPAVLSDRSWDFLPETGI